MKKKCKEDIEAVKKELQEWNKKTEEEAKSGLGDLEGMAGGRLEEVVQVGRSRREIIYQVANELGKRGEKGDV